MRLRPLLITIFFSVAPSAASLSGTARVLHIDHERRVVYFDAGKQQSLELGKRVCVDTAKGRARCGVVVHLGGQISGARFESSALKDIKPGSELRGDMLASEAPRTPDARPASQPPQSKPQVAQVSPAPAPQTIATEAPAERQPASTGIGINWIFTPRLPFIVNVPAYDIEAEIRGGGSLWQKDRSVDKSLVGATLGAQIPMSPIVAVAPSVVYRYVPTDELDVDFDRLDPTVFAHGKFSAQSLGLYVDALIPAPKPDGFSASGVVGAGAEASEVKYAVSEIGGPNEGRKVASYNSTLVTPMLKAGTLLQLATGRVHWGLSLEGLLPLSSKAKIKQSDHDLDDNVPQREDSKADLAKTIGHERGRLGVQSMLALTYRM